jgi:hypothetical protein
VTITRLTCLVTLATMATNANDLVFIKIDCVSLTGVIVKFFGFEISQLAQLSFKDLLACYLAHAVEKAFINKYQCSRLHLQQDSAKVSFQASPQASSDVLSADVTGPCALLFTGDQYQYLTFAFKSLNSGLSNGAQRNAFTTMMDKSSQRGLPQRKDGKKGTQDFTVDIFNALITSLGNEGLDVATPSIPTLESLLNHIRNVLQTLHSRVKHTRLPERFRLDVACASNRDRTKFLRPKLQQMINDIDDSRIRATFLPSSCWQSFNKDVLQLRAMLQEEIGKLQDNCAKVQQSQAREKDNANDRIHDLRSVDATIDFLPAYAAVSNQFLEATSRERPLQSGEFRKMFVRQVQQQWDELVSDNGIIKRAVQFQDDTPERFLVRLVGKNYNEEFAAKGDGYDIKTGCLSSPPWLETNMLFMLGEVYKCRAVVISDANDAIVQRYFDFQTSKLVLTKRCIAARPDLQENYKNILYMMHVQGSHYVLLKPKQME